MEGAKDANGSAFAAVGPVSDGGWVGDAAHQPNFFAEYLLTGDYSDVPQNTTLGGQEATLREASKLSKRWTRRIKVGYEEHIEKLLAICIATMDPVEVYTYLENDAAQSAWMVRDVSMGVLGGALLVMRLPWAVRSLGLVLLVPVLAWQPARPGAGQFELLAADIGQVGGNADAERAKRVGGPDA